MSERKAHKRKGAAAKLRATPGPGRVLHGLALSGSTGEFDRLIHERLRLAIVSALAVHDALSFNELKDMLGVSDGNLSVHARKLEQAGYLTCSKTFEGRMPKTRYRLTGVGRKSLERHLAHMEALIKSVRER